jgi:3-(3-hydroxy-phenyl)propionate hydroxylase
LFGAALSMRNRPLAWLRDRVLLAIRNIPTIRDYVLQMRFKPMPRFSTGVVLNSGMASRDERVGRMFIQPNVEVASGDTRRLDDVVGGRFALIGWRRDPLATAPTDLLEKLRRLGCDRFVAVRSRSSEAEIGLPDSARQAVPLLQDVDNDLHFWFQATGVDWVLIRPDRFVAAVGGASDAVSQLTQFCNAVLPVSVSRAPAPASFAVPLAASSAG